MTPAQLEILVRCYNKRNGGENQKLQGKGKHGNVSPFMTG